MLAKSGEEEHSYCETNDQKPWKQLGSFIRLKHYFERYVRKRSTGTYHVMKNAKMRSCLLVGFFVENWFGRSMQLWRVVKYRDRWTEESYEAVSRFCCTPLNFQIQSSLLRSSNLYHLQNHQKKVHNDGAVLRFKRRELHKKFKRLQKLRSSQVYDKFALAVTVSNDANHYYSSRLSWLKVRIVRLMTASLAESRSTVKLRNSPSFMMEKAC